jgi:ribokinase
VHPSHRSTGGLSNIDIVIVNEHEAEDFAVHLGLPTGRAEATAAALAERLGRTVIATLGPEGAVAAGREGIVRVPALQVTPVDTTGAGDTFAGVLAASMGGLRPEAMAYTAVAGSACKHGASRAFRQAEIEKAAG